MSDDRFRAYREEVFRLYNESRYAEALAHVERGAPRFRSVTSNTKDDDRLAQ